NGVAKLSVQRSNRSHRRGRCQSGGQSTEHDPVSLESTDVPPLLRLDERTTILPIIHGSGQFAWLTRRFLLEHRFDCVAVSLPESFRQCVEQAVLDLPKPSIVIQRPTPDYESTYDPASGFSET